MPRNQKLKVFRTPVGFHDAYVAAPSQKAALAAWGSDSDLFAQKIAEEVTDPELMRELLAKPGEVIRKLRGTEKEQVEALGPGPAKKAKAQASTKARPKPSRAALTEAEVRLRLVEDRHAGELRVLEEKLKTLKARLSALKVTHAAELKKAAKLCTEEQKRFDRALAKWKKA
jgi:hypothetical protein